MIYFTMEKIVFWFYMYVCDILVLKNGFLFLNLHWFLTVWGFAGGSDGTESACNAGDAGSVPELWRFPGGGNGNPLQHSCSENPLDRRAWWATVHGDMTEWLTHLHCMNLSGNSNDSSRWFNWVSTNSRHYCTRINILTHLVLHRLVL